MRFLKSLALLTVLLGALPSYSLGASIMDVGYAVWFLKPVGNTGWRDSEFSIETREGGPEGRKVTFTAMVRSDDAGRVRVLVMGDHFGSKIFDNDADGRVDSAEEFGMSGSALSNTYAYFGAQGMYDRVIYAIITLAESERR